MVREQNSRFDAYTQVTSTALVESTPRSWYRDGSNVLHVNAGVWYVDNSSISPNNLALEASKNNSIGGILVETGADGCRVDGIRVDGFGTNDADLGSNIVGIAERMNSTYSCVISNCTSMFSGGTHVMIHYLGGATPSTPGASGGYGYFINCKAGGTKSGSISETIFNSYSIGGGQETIWYNCECVRGTAPHSSWYSEDPTSLTLYPKRGTAFLCHAGGDVTRPTGLVLVYKGKVRSANRAGAMSDCSLGDTNSAATLRSPGAIIWKMDQDVAPGTQNAIAVPYVARAFGKCVNRPARPFIGNGLSLNARHSGWICGVEILMDFGNFVYTDQVMAMYNGNQSVGNNDPKFYHCTIRVVNASGTLTGSIFDYDTIFQSGVVTVSQDAECMNCVVSFEGGGGTWYLGMNNDASKMKNIAIFGITDTPAGSRGYANVPGLVQLKYAPVKDQRPMPSDDTYRTGTTLCPFKLGNRQAPSIGHLPEYTPPVKRRVA
jgi:hypothetical protein